MIRQAKKSDAADLAELMTELGYVTTEDEMRQRLSHLLSVDSYHTAVFEGNHAISGMIGMSHSFAYHSNDTHLRIIAFVVKEEARGRGVGRLLMNEAERWAECKGATTLILNSGNRKERQDAHDIYRHFGFDGKSTGFYKNLR